MCLYHLLVALFGGFIFIATLGLMSIFHLPFPYAIALSFGLFFVAVIVWLYRHPDFEPDWEPGLGFNIQMLDFFGQVIMSFFMISIASVILIRLFHRV